MAEPIISATRPVVTMRKVDNALLVTPVDDALMAKLAPKLSYEERRNLVGYKARQAGRKLDFVTHRLFDRSPTSCLTMFGLWDIVWQLLRDEGYAVNFEDHTAYAQDRRVPDWNNLAGLTFRTGQREFLEAVTRNTYGRFDCPTAFGKSFMIRAIAQLYPRARIDVVSRSVPVIYGRIFRELIDTIGDVGIVCSEKKIMNRRVMCYSLNSTHRANGDADILIGDECHQLCTEDATEKLAKWTRSRNYGLSASMDMRWDGHDLRSHALFGPVVFRLSYQDAVRSANVVPIVVKWTKIRMDLNPASGYEDIDKKRYGLWQNAYRNEKIAAAARLYGPDVQVLNCVDTIEHAVYLKKLLPDFTMVYNPSSFKPSRKAGYVAAGLLSEDEPINDRNRHRQLTEAFERGELKKVIATTIWNVGVSFDALSFLIRAAGGASDTGSVQIPGRVARIHETKTHGILHDFDDVFDAGFARNSKQRMSIYEQLGFSQEKEAASALEIRRR